MAKQSAIERSNPFIFNAIPPNSSLKRDEPSLIVRVMCIGIFFLAAIDIAVVVFYYRTSARINVIRNDNFTEVIITNLEESQLKHETFSNQAKEIIRNKNSNIKEFIDHMEFDSKAMDGMKKEFISLPRMNKLIEKLQEIEASNKLDIKKINDAAGLYNQVEDELKNMDKYLMPIKEFNGFQNDMEKTLQTILDEIKRNLDGFRDQLNSLAGKQQLVQTDLMKEIKATLNSFGETYNFVKKNDGTDRKLNNYYEVKFIEYDQDYVPFSIEFKVSIFDGHVNKESINFGAQLTKESTFNLQTPRTYFCTIEASLTSENPFNVRMQYVDKSDDENEYDTVLFETENLQGGMFKSVTYSDVKVFKIDKGVHTLYLRVISEGSASQLRIADNKMVCLSYRNFRAGAKNKEQADDDV